MKLLVVFLAPLGLIGGLAAGHFVAPAPDEILTEETAKAEESGGNEKPDAVASLATGRKRAPEPKGEAEYAKLDKHFVVPIIENETVAALVVVTMAIEVEQGTTDLVYLHEPKLRDEFLSVLFNHGRSGAFQNGFTEPQNLEDLRNSLNEASIHVIGEASRQVLLTSIIRQDM
ncbi:MAG: flagellar basal body-associated protein FliL [Pikeienuella sp.]